MRERVRGAIVAAIRDRGPISFAEFMELALYGSGGYYERPPVGGEGDFVTSPHIHPVFGRLLAGALRELHGALGSPELFRVQEVGGGDGTLARQLVDALGDLSIDYLVVERSAGAREALRGVDGIRTDTRLEHGAHVVLAHELLDNLPFRRVRRTRDGPKEVRVGEDPQGRLVEVPVEAGDDLQAAADGLDVGEETVVPDGALQFVEDVAAALERGYALVIDYGGLGGPGGEVHGYRGHGLVDDVLGKPGETDVTSGVDFALVTQHARRHGLVAFPTVTQRQALLVLGFREWTRDERGRQVDLLGQGEGVDAVRVWSGRNRANLLVDPSALGRHRWLLLATSGLQAPGWLRPPEPG
jgi:SAM-dependent MidA family methyltransferase